MSLRSWNFARRVVPAVAVLAGAAGLVLLVLRLQAPPDGPQPVVWDRTPCAECRMAVSEPPYAAQLQLADGRVLAFDDAGCLFRYLAAHETPVRAVYLHHLREDRWLPAAQAGFVEAGPSPMAYGLAAVDRAREGGLTFAEARERVLGGASEARHGAP